MQNLSVLSRGLVHNSVPLPKYDPTIPDSCHPTSPPSAVNVLILIASSLQAVCEVKLCKIILQMFEFIYHQEDTVKVEIVASFKTGDAKKSNTL